MKHTLSNKTLWFLFIGLLLVGIIGSGAAIGLAKTTSNEAKVEALPQNSKVWITAGEATEKPLHTLPPKEYLLNAPQTANITVTYVGTWDTAAHDAFEYAVSIWETQITSPIEIKIIAEWSNLGAGILGGAGSAASAFNFTNAPVANTRYPIALANKLAGTDLYTASDDCGTSVSINGPDICASFNSGFSSWYFGTDGNPPGNLYDFASVVLHEVGHGLGFFGSMTKGSYCGGSDLGCWGYGFYTEPFIYDRFTENNAGTALLSYQNFSSELGSQLTSGGVYFDGPNANAANGNTRVPLYAPATWQQGSSYSHLAESFNGTGNALMTYSLGPGEVQHAPGPVMLGMFKDMGWNTSGSATATPTNTALPPCPAVTPQPTIAATPQNYLPLVPRTISNCYASPTPTPTQPAGTWTTLLSENFEGAFPGNWELYPPSGDYVWGKRNCQAFGGSYSGWGIGGGALGQNLSCGSNYPNDIDTWMISTPFSLVGATDAEMSAKGWISVEAGYDKFCFYASTDNQYFYGTCYTYDTSGWEDFVLDLTDVYIIGDLRGQPNVWVALRFFSDGTINDPVGVYVDNLIVRKCSSGVCAANLETPVQNSTNDFYQLQR